MSEKDQLDYLAVDAGYGNTRLFGAKGGVVLPSLVATNGAQSVSKWAAGDLRRATHMARPVLIETEYGTYYVGPGAHEAGRPVENLDLDRMTGPEMKALLYGALAQYGAPRQANLIIALPIAMALGSDGDVAKEQAKAMLQGEHTWWIDDKKHTLIVKEVAVTSQPAGAMFDFLLTNKGEMPPDKKILRRTKSFGLLSLGFNTIEMMVVEEGRLIEKHVAGENKGVHYLLDLLNPEQAYSLGELDGKLRAGKLDIGAVLPRWQREVMGQIEKHWGKAVQRFAAVFVVGGGTFLIRDALLAKFKDKLVIPDDPILSIARGCYKYTLFKYGQE
ncbi:hypothetical protein PLCT2_00961 [Planctomycetaceae bacterium]|nr:hypothetical protein PLCT2_00961 [Planctomycetaceae bacterium]